MVGVGVLLARSCICRVRTENPPRDAGTDQKGLAVVTTNWKESGASIADVHTLRLGHSQDPGAVDEERRNGECLDRGVAARFRIGFFIHMRNGIGKAILTMPMRLG